MVKGFSTENFEIEIKVKSSASLQLQARVEGKGVGRGVEKLGVRVREGRGGDPGDKLGRGRDS